MRRISSGKYEYKGYSIFNHGYHSPDKCIVWEATNIQTGCADFHAKTKKHLKELIDNDKILSGQPV